MMIKLIVTMMMMVKINENEQPKRWTTKPLQIVLAFSMKFSHFLASFTLIIRCSGACKFVKEIARKFK